jgi:hypothetical protein
VSIIRVLAVGSILPREDGLCNRKSPVGKSHVANPIHPIGSPYEDGVSEARLLSIKAPAFVILFLPTKRIKRLKRAKSFYFSGTVKI